MEAEMEMGSSELNLDSVSSFDLNILEGRWDIQAIYTIGDSYKPKALYFRPLDVKVLDKSTLEIKDGFLNTSSNEIQEEVLKLTNDQNDPALFFFNGNQDQIFRVVYYEEISSLMFPGGVIEVGELGEMEGGNIERDIPLESLEVEMENGEFINVEGVLGPRIEEMNGEVLIAEVHQGDNHFLICFTRGFDGVFDLRRFLRENNIKYEIDKTYFQYPIVQPFDYKLLENFTAPELNGEWHLLGAYEGEDHPRLAPWELGYCPDIKVELSETNDIKIDFHIKLLLGGDFSRVWTVFPRGDEKGVVIGFVSDIPVPIGVIDMNENGLLVAITNDGAAFLIASPSWTGDDLTQDDINYFRSVLDDNLKEELSDFYLNFFHRDECIASS